MGNWRTVHIQGTCAPEDVPALRERLDLDFGDEAWGCLHGGGICGLGNWAAEVINAAGNLGERDYTPDDVAEELRRLLSEVAPSLRVKVDCGGDYESTDCVATVLVGEDSLVAVLPPSVASVSGIDEGVMLARLFKAMGR